MRTESQNEASRLNGALSKGPVTEAGKAISSRNAVRHGLLSRTLVLEGESEDRFQQHLDLFIAQFEPNDKIELALVEQMAVCRWRQLTIWGMETAGISETIRQLAEASPDLLQKDPSVRAFQAVADLSAKSRTLDVCHRYDARFDRQYYRAFSKLMARKK
jgi:hypothetical protein